MDIIREAPAEPRIDNVGVLALVPEPVGSRMAGALIARYMMDVWGLVGPFCG